MVEVRDRVREFLANNFLLTPGRFPHGDDDSLMDAGVVDSTGVLELILFLEETYGIEVADTDATPENLDTLARIETFVARKGASASAG